MIDFKEFLVEETDEDRLKQVYDSAIGFIKSQGDSDQFLTALGGVARLNKWGEPKKSWIVTFSKSKIKCRDLAKGGVNGEKVGTHEYNPGTPIGKDWYNLSDGTRWKKMVDAYNEGVDNGSVKGTLFLLWWFSKKGTETTGDVDFENADLKIAGARQKGELGNATEFYEQIAATQFRIGNKSYDLDEIKKRIGTSETGGSGNWSDDTFDFYEKTDAVSTIANGVISYLNRHSLPSNKFTIIHDDIQDYYDRLRNATGGNYTIDGAKDNTADLVLYSGDYDNLFSAQISHEPDSGGVLKVGDDDWILQVSLKISESGAQVGKLKTDYKPWTLTSGGVSFHKSAIDSVSQKLGLSEGIFDSITSIVKKSFKSIVLGLTKAFGKLKKITKSLISSLSRSKVEKEVSNLSRDYIRKFGIKEEYYLFESMSKQLDALGKFADSSDDNRRLVFETITQDVEEYKNSLEKTIEKVNANLDVGYKILTTIQTINKDKPDLINMENTDIKSLLVNIASFRTLEKYYSMFTSGQVFDEIIEKSIEIAINAVMGESSLPVLKLFGLPAGESGTNWEILRRDSVKYDTNDIKAKVKMTEYPLGGVSIIRSTSSGVKGNRSNNRGYYSTKQFSLGWLKVEEPKENETEEQKENRISASEPQYLQIYLRTSGDAYFIESNSVVSRDEVEKHCGSL